MTLAEFLADERLMLGVLSRRMVSGLGEVIFQMVRKLRFRGRQRGFSGFVLAQNIP